MLELLGRLETEGGADILTVTIDSHTRLGRFDHALRALLRDPAELNGYPMVAHGWARARELTEATGLPLEVRHGSPDARLLFRHSIAAGVTSFEGGGISYNLPYSKDVPLHDSLSAWAEVDTMCGELAELGVVVDRELFGSLTGVLMPPAISLAVGLLEAVTAVSAGVRCVSLSYPQGGNVVQDVAALRSIPELAARYLPRRVEVHSVLHQFMGVFPRRRRHAEQVIFLGALVARLGRASKVVTKTYREAFGLPDGESNVASLRLSDLANSPLLNFVSVDEAEVAEEQAWIEREVAGLVEPLLEKPDLRRAVVEAFDAGRMDIPFSASRHARGEVIPCRDRQGAIRMASWGGLPLSAACGARNRRLAHQGAGGPPEDVFTRLEADVFYFREFFGEAWS